MPITATVTAVAAATGFMVCRTAFEVDENAVRVTKENNTATAAPNAKVLRFKFSPVQVES